MNPWLKKLPSTVADKRGLLLIIMLGGSLSFVGLMSLDKFVEVNANQASLQTIVDLEKEITELRIQYRDAHPEAQPAVLEQAELRLLQDFTHLAQWAQELQEQGEEIALGMNYKILKEQQTPSTIQGITVIPLELKIHSQNNRSGYRQFLQFLQVLEQSGPRINIQEVAVTGDGKKATQFTVGFSVWMKTQDSVEL